MTETPPETPPETPETPPETPVSPISESVLETVKSGLGIPKEHAAFDAEILLHLNSALSAVAQVGVGPEEGVYITGYDQLWSDIIGDDRRLNNIKAYVTLKIKTVFDAPEIGFVLTALKDAADEALWRANIHVDNEIPQKEVTDVDA